MEQRTHIVEALKQLSVSFPEAQFSYIYDETHKQHVVRVGPTVLFNAEEYQSHEADTIFNFINQFPNDDLLFIDAVDQIETPEPEILIGHPIAMSEKVATQVSGDCPYTYPQVEFALYKGLTNRIAPAITKGNPIIVIACEDDYAMAA